MIEQQARTILSFIGFVVALIPLYWLLQAFNVGCILYSIWVAIVCLCQFINGVMFMHTAEDLSPAWCEISTRLQLMGGMGIVAAGLVIARRVSRITTDYALTFDERREIYVDLFIGLAPPFSQLIEYYFMQGHRYNVLEGIGCYPAIPSSIIYLSLSGIWPIIIGLASAVYCARTIWALFRRHRQIKELVASTNGLSLNKYYRLMVMATIEMLCTVPLGTYDLLGAVRSYYPWNGFADLHLNFDRVSQYPHDLIRKNWGHAPTGTLWYTNGCALIFFALFGFTSEARSFYGRVFLYLPRRLGLLTKNVVDIERGGMQEQDHGDFVLRQPQVQDILTIDLEGSARSVESGEPERSKSNSTTHSTESFT
ncbi:STE3-domain-containing protein [Panus rudis PR-1116 ss-1]|nr:STE3-domain-containing protein [Panus rudis PR-1116 ss-1]